MIYSKFSIANPWAKDNFRNVKNWSGRFLKSKAWELEIISSNWYLLHLEFEISFRGKDHAGLNLELGLLGFVVCFCVYERRHWDYKSNKWENSGGGNVSS